jgi:predicted ATPase
MKIVQLLVENFKKVRVVEIRPDGKVIQLTGRNGQGKTSVLDALWFGLRGTKALPANKNSVVRRGSERAKVKVGTEDFVITRTIGSNSTAPTLEIEMLNGKKRDRTPQDFLDELFGKLTFDPQEFATMTPAEQVEELKKTAKVDLDFEAIAEENAKDYDERLAVGREIKTLEGQLTAFQVLDGLPKEKLDEQAILDKLNQAGEANKRAQEVFQAKQELGAEAARKGIARQNGLTFIDQSKEKIESLKKQLELAKQALEVAREDQKRLEAEHKAAEQVFQAAPAGEPIDVGALTTELQSAQRTNRAIDTRNQWEKVRAQLEAKRQQSAQINRQMEAREEKKTAALAKAKMPVEGLTFDERGVKFNGIPLENLGEGEQLRVAAEIGMAANPKLRILCIRRGEALDEEGLKMLAELAAARDFQLWITKVDSSGKVGVVLEDGMVIAQNKAMGD